MSVRIDKRPVIGLLGAAAALVLSAGCTAGGTGSPATSSFGGDAQRQSLARTVGRGSASVLLPGTALRAGRAAAGPGFDLEPGSAGAIAISDYANGAIDIFNASGKMTAQLTGLSGPQGLGADLKGNLYVANTNASQIFVYKSFKGTPRTLNVSGFYPAGVAADIKGNIGVTDICNATSCGQGGITFFNASGKLIKTLQSNAIYRAYFGGFDAKGNFFADGETSSGGGAVVEVKGGASGKSIVALSGFSFGFPGGVNVEKNGDICIGDQLGGITCYSLEGTTLTPKSTTPLNAGSGVTFTFTSSEADLRTVSGSSEYEYAFPQGGNPVSSFAVGGDGIGIVTNPTFRPVYSSDSSDVPA